MSRELDPRPIYYVYVLFDWLGAPFYVGKGKGDRWLGHSSQSDQYNPLKKRIIKQTIAAIGDLPKLKVRESLTELEAFKIEIVLILVLGRIENGTGSLTNLTDGGDGISGHKHTSKTRTLMRQRAKEVAAQRTIEERSRIARKREAAISPEMRREKATKASHAIPTERRIANGRKAGLRSAQIVPPEQRPASAKAINARQTPEQRSARQRLGNARQTPEQRSERQRKAKMSQTAEVRSVQSSAAGHARWDALSTEERRASLQKSWETRRAKNQYKSPPPRLS